MFTTAAAASLNGHDIALILAATVPAMGAFLLGWLNLRRQVTSSQQISQINNAVNHQPSDAPTLINRVLTIEQNMVAHNAWEATHSLWQHEALETIANQVGCRLKEPPTPQWDL